MGGCYRFRQYSLLHFGSVCWPSLLVHLRCESQLTIKLIHHRSCCKVHCFFYSAAITLAIGYSMRNELIRNEFNEMAKVYIFFRHYSFTFNWMCPNASKLRSETHKNLLIRFALQYSGGSLYFMEISYYYCVHENILNADEIDLKKSYRKNARRKFVLLCARCSWIDDVCIASP